MSYYNNRGVCHNIVVKAVSYKPEGRGFKTWWSE
jgi:hypothetical protein